MKKSYIIWIVIVIIVVAGAIYAALHPSQNSGGSVATSTATSTNSQTGSQQVSYACDAGKTIDAAYTDGESKPAAEAGQPPVPGGSVALTLSDGRAMTLPQTISGSGIRYANADESVVFWSKGNGAFITENNVQTFSGCLQVAADPGNLSKVYESGSQGFSLRYPAAFTADSKYIYQALGPGKDIGGVKFTIDPALAAGTNLGADSYISVEEVPKAENCSADLFLDQSQGGKAATVTDNGVTYSVASTTGAGAGNRYEETVYAIPGTNPCMAVRYFIHYSALENYPAGTVKQFDESALKSTFDSIRHTLVIGQ
jgi:membrane-bound inhibitor of C-type lysozyme